MDEAQFLSSLEDLTGKTAIVTGGTQGIGLQTTLYLATLNARVYVCALSTPKDLECFAASQATLQQYAHTHDCRGSIIFHPLDLSSIRKTKSSVEELRMRIDGDAGGEGKGRVDILICNAGIMFSPQTELTVDGYEKTWGVNCLGHFVFTTALLDTIERTAKIQDEARIVLISSEGYKLVRPPSYTALTTPIPGDGTSIFHLPRSFLRYCNSKLGIIYLTHSLNLLLKSQGVANVYVNAAHPGRAPTTEIGDFQQTFMSAAANRWLKWAITLGYRVGNTVEDCAKTQVFLAASERLREGDVRDEYWVPRFDWRGRWVSCQKEELTVLGGNEEEARKMWMFCEDAVEAAGVGR